MATTSRSSCRFHSISDSEKENAASTSLSVCPVSDKNCSTIHGLAQHLKIHTSNRNDNVAPRTSIENYQSHLEFFLTGKSSGITLDVGLTAKKNDVESELALDRKGYKIDEFLEKTIEKCFTKPTDYCDSTKAAQLVISNVINIQYCEFRIEDSVKHALTTDSSQFNSFERRVQILASSTLLSLPQKDKEVNKFYFP
ncbi:hypothetical protein NPIL_214381 [Nephila pilipes]|uniref:Uncharacterized protein n=1 Tax=Nephila pilipes TaxID=299642 RepID=A0A8X6Q400_NEPPI|nr:hypothetical protein NPIL_214381 [Nephila pilipes]